MRPTPRWSRAALYAVVALLAVGVGYVALGSPLTVVIRGIAADQRSGAHTGNAPHAADRQSAAGPPVSAPAAGAPGRNVAVPREAAMPVGDLPNWRQTYTDDFDGNHLGADWFAYAGQPESDPGGYFSPTHVSVGHGHLTIGAWPEQAQGNRYVTGGVSLVDTRSQTYGRYEVRFRMDLGKGVSYALLLWPKSNNSPPEVDFAEDNGRARDATYVTLHPTTQRKALGRGVAGDFTQWHTVGLEWTPGLLVFTVDGQEWTRMTGDVVPTEPMTLALQSQSWYCGHGWEACPDAGTPARVNLYIDWAVQYAWRG